jgi:spore coat protein H
VSASRSALRAGSRVFTTYCMLKRSALLALLLSSTVLGASCAKSDKGGGNDATATPTPEESPTPPLACEPAAGGPYWLLEKETVTFTVSCASGMDSAIEVTPLPEGASFDAGTRVFTWTPGLAAAAVHKLDLHVAATGETGRVVVGVADRWEDPDNVLVVDPTQYTEELGLPVLFLSPGPEGDDLYAPATIVYAGRTYEAEAKKRGVTSIHYPMNSYTLRFAKEDKFHDLARGFDGVRRIALTQTFDDNSYLRNRLAFTFWNRLDPAHVQIHAYSAVVYVDGKYWGLYTITDHVDDNLMRDNGLEEGGELFKAITAEANWDTTLDGLPKSKLHAGFVKKEGLPEHGTSGAYQSIDDAINFVATTTDDAFFSQLDTKFETREYMHWWIFARLIHAEDSPAKNSWHYLPATPGAKWHYVPWDFNASFGQNYATVRRGADSTNDFTHRNKIFARMRTNPGRRAQIDTLYREAQAGPWKKEDLLAIVDQFAAEIAPSAKRNELKWGAAYRSYPSWNTRTDFTNWEGEVAYLRAWLSQRWEYEDASH